ncbi:hypothetical protein V6574_16295 [Streptomyces sp. SM1P]
MALHDGVERITVRDTRTRPDGTGHLGTFDFTPGPATVTLTNHGQIVMGVATARWKDETGKAATSVVVSDAPA